jgi:hypothetical protein
VQLKNRDTTLFNWGTRYINENYKPAGIVNFSSNNGGDFCWNTPQLNCTPKAKDWIGIYVRKENNVEKNQ